MEYINYFKPMLCGAIGIVGGIVAESFGGFDDAMITLVILMVIDYLTGLAVAGVFHNSKKSADGGIESKAGFKGLVKKGIILLFVLVAVRLDIALHTKYIREAVVFGFIANELISIIENAGLMNIPLPESLTKAITVLTEKKNIK